ncbi:MAG: tRNA (adenosine(37)-N6)-threonylcarbamoyltransferase complex dimerization subunit type 1 TsaB [Anaerolineaceae bacterium]|nr:tRNA (adenosine(37)-N6)-threonylcarbamoyltransferase complex dimerization subunit type 1 TsaB [Anaerolineaceae bacterium]
MLLAIDTSTSWISLALYDGISVLYETTWQSQHHHTVELAPAIDQLFERTGTQPSDLNGIAVAIGPGSFTSLRIGVAAAKGLALALKIPLVGVPSLDILAAAQPLDEIPLIAVLHAGRTRLAYITYLVEGGAWQPQHEPAAIDASDLVKTIESPTLIAGELSEEARTVLGRRWKNAMIAPPARCLRRAGYLAEIGWERLMSDRVDNPVTLAPIYLSTVNNIPA